VVDSVREYFHPYPLTARRVVADERWPRCEFRCPSPAGQASLGAFADDMGRKAHLECPIAAALTANAAELLAKPPQIEQVDVLALKIAR